MLSVFPHILIHIEGCYWHIDPTREKLHLNQKGINIPLFSELTHFRIVHISTMVLNTLRPCPILQITSLVTLLDLIICTCNVQKDDYTSIAHVHCCFLK